MSISFIGIGALSTHADTITPAYPAGATAGRLAVLTVVSGHSAESTPSTPSGWSPAGSLTGGGGAFGSGTGPRRLTYFVRELAGSDAAPTTAIPSGDTGSHIAGRITVLSRSAGTGWRWTAAFGEDTSADTSFSAVCTETPTWAAGDFVLLGYAIRSSAPTLSAEAVSATGITFSAVTEQADDAVSTGHTARLAVATGSVSSGSGTQAPTVTATLSASHTGSGGVLRVREASSDVNASPQSVFPPRNLVSVTGMLADDIVSATIYREVGNTRTVVRAADTVDVTGTDALLRVDAEQPFNVEHNYAAELTDVSGLVWTVYSGPITSTVTGDVISDAIRGIGALVQIASWPDKKRDREAATFNVGGRIVVVSRPRSSASATVLVRTHTTEEGDALEEVLASATEGVVLIRARSSMQGVDGHVVALSDTEDRNWYDEVRRWTLDVIETEPWPTLLEAAGFTLQDVADNYNTLQDLADDNATLLDLALKDFGV